MMEIIRRHDAAVVSEDISQRIVDVIAVPYDQEAEVPVRGEIWREVFDRSAFKGIEDHAGRVPVNREHQLGYTVGRVVRLDPYDERGLIASIKMASTERGEDTLRLAAEGMLGASIGYYVKNRSDVQENRKLMLRRVMRGFLHHIAMTDSPAYVGAETVATRAELAAQVTAGEQPLITPSLDEFLADDIFSWASERLSGK